MADESQTQPKTQSQTQSYGESQFQLDPTLDAMK